MADRELRGQRDRDLRGQRTQDPPGYVLAAMLLGQGVADVVLDGRAPLEQQRAEPSPGKALDGKRAIDAFLADCAGADEKDPESRHDPPIIA